jgi:hypothetical protein
LDVEKFHTRAKWKSTVKALILLRMGRVHNGSIDPLG